MKRQWRVLRWSRILSSEVAEPYSSEEAARDGAFLGSLGGFPARIQWRLPGQATWTDLASTP